MIARITRAEELVNTFPESCLNGYEHLQDLINCQVIFRIDEGYIRLFPAKTITVRYLAIDNMLPYWPKEVGFLKEVADYAQDNGFADLLLPTWRSDVLYALAGIPGSYYTFKDKVNNNTSPFFSIQAYDLMLVGRAPILWQENETDPSGDFASMFRFYNMS